MLALDPEMSRISLKYQKGLQFVMLRADLEMEANLLARVVIQQLSKLEWGTE
jgi:hypothetical protein